MAHALLARNNQNGNRCLSLSLPYDGDHDTREFRELLDVIDSSANTNDSCVPWHCSRKSRWNHAVAPQFKWRSINSIIPLDPTQTEKANTQNELKFNTIIILREF